MRASINLNTGKMIESSSTTDAATLIANANAQGFQNVEIREVTDAEHDALISARDANPAAEKSVVLDEFRKLRDTALARLNGIQMDSTVQADIDAIKVAKQGLKDMPQHATVVAAVGGDATEDALQALYVAVSLQLYQSAPAAYTAFRGLDL